MSENPYKSRRVGITGMGVISFIGIGMKAFWDNLIMGKPGIGVVERFDRSKFTYSAANLSSSICRYFNLRGESYVLPNACAAANYCLGYAPDIIRSGKRRVMLAGGAALFLESLEQARARGAHVYAEYVWGAFISEGWKVTYPDVTNNLYGEMIRGALKKACLETVVGGIMAL